MSPRLHFWKRAPLAASENILKQLVDYDVVVLMDDSASMDGSLWKQAKKVMKKVVHKASEYDDDGIEIQFLNSRNSGIVKSKHDTKHMFDGVRPRGSTPLGSRLGVICKEYLDKLENATQQPKRCLIIAITDGAPDFNDKPKVYSTIKDSVRRLDKLGAPLSQLGIQFVQIGHDPIATAFLTELDDNLKGEESAGKVARDIVDTVPYDGYKLTYQDMVKILAGAINRRVDNQNKYTPR